MKETATKFLSFLDQCFVKLRQLSMTESQLTFAADHKTESDLWCLVIFYIFFYMTHSMCVCVFVLLNIIRAFLGVVVQISLLWQVNFFD